MLVRAISSREACDNCAFVQDPHPKLVNHYHSRYHPNLLRTVFAVLMVFDLRIAKDILFPSTLFRVPSVKVCLRGCRGAIDYLVLVSSLGSVQGPIVCLIERSSRM